MAHAITAIATYICKCYKISLCTDLQWTNNRENRTGSVKAVVEDSQGRVDVHTTCMISNVS